MADADKVHTKLPGRWQNLYKQICEDHWENEYLAQSAMKPLKKDIGVYGNPPYYLFKKQPSILTVLRLLHLHNHFLGEK